MNELNRIDAKIGDGSTALTILAEQVKGGKRAMQIVGDTLHAGKSQDYMSKLMHYAKHFKGKQGIPKSVSERLFQEVHKMQSALDWAADYAVKSKGGKAPLDNLPSWLDGTNFEKLKTYF